MGSRRCRLWRNWQTSQHLGRRWVAPERARSAAECGQFVIATRSSLVRDSRRSTHVAPRLLPPDGERNQIREVRATTAFRATLEKRAKTRAPCTAEAGTAAASWVVMKIKLGFSTVSVMAALALGGCSGTESAEDTNSAEGASSSVPSKDSVRDAIEATNAEVAAIDSSIASMTTSGPDLSACLEGDLERTAATDGTGTIRRLIVATGNKNVGMRIATTYYFTDYGVLIYAAKHGATDHHSWQVRSYFTGASRKIWEVYRAADTGEILGDTWEHPEGAPPGTDRDEHSDYRNDVPASFDPRAVMTSPAFCAD